MLNYQSIMEKHLVNHAEQNGKMVYIDTVANGLKCNCICPYCKEPLIAKNNGKIHRHHFAHRSKECKYAFQTMLHKLTKEIFIENVENFIVPQIKIYISNIFRYIDITKLYNKFNKAECEVNLGNIIPDIVLTDENNRKLLIEIKVTHEVNEDKKRKIKENKLSCIEYDLSYIDRNIRKEELKEILFNCAKVKLISFHFDDKEKDRFIANFMKNDKYEAIPIDAIQNQKMIYCGIKNQCCSNCPYYGDQIENMIICKYKVENFEKNNKFASYTLVRNEKYFITEIKYIYQNKNHSLSFQVFDERNDDWKFSSDQTICIDGNNYTSSEKPVTIDILWKKKKNRNQILVINNKNEAYKILLSSYKNRKKNKSIKAFKLRKKENILVDIIDYNKKIWKELTKIKKQ